MSAPPLRIALSVCLGLSLGLLATGGRAAAQTVADPPPEATAPPSIRWSVALLGGALAPARAMRDDHQDALLAGVRVGLTTRVGLSATLAFDYSPLPRREIAAETFDTTYGTIALLPGWTFGRGRVRLRLAAGGGVALERTSVREDPMAGATSATPAALAQLALELHVTDGGGLVLASGATKTFDDGARAYEYGWALAGLKLEL